MTAPGAPTRHDRQRAETRRRLTEAGRVLITEKGVEGLRISEITERADVGLGSFYNHFPSKDELVEAVVGDALADLASRVGIQPDEHRDPAEVVSTAVRRFVSLARVDPPFARLVVALDHADDLFFAATETAARRALEHGVAIGRFVVSDPETSLVTVIGGCLALLRAILQGRSFREADVAYAEAVLRSLGLPADEAAEVSRASR